MVVVGCISAVYLAHSRSSSTQALAVLEGVVCKFFHKLYREWENTVSMEVLRYSVLTDNSVKLVLTALRN